MSYGAIVGERVKDPLISCNVLAMYAKEILLAEACFKVDLVGRITSSSLSGCKLSM